MKILFCTNEQIWPLTGGGSVGNLKIVEKMVEREHNVSVISPLYTDKNEVEKRFKIKMFDFSPFYMHRSARLLIPRYILYSFLFTFYYINHLIKNKYDMIFVRNTIIALPIGLLNIIFRKKITISLTDFLSGFLYETKTPKPLVDLFLFLEKRIPKLFGKIFVITPLMKRDLVDIGISKDRIKITYDGVDIKLFKKIKGSQKLKRKLNLKGKTVVFSGSIESYHGVNTFKKIVKKVLLRKKINFLVIGGGGKYKELKESINDKNIKFLGFVQHNDVPKYLNLGNIGIIPYKKNYNLDRVLTLKLLEYLGIGLPVVCFNLESIKEVFGRYKFVKISMNEDEFVNNIIKTINTERSNASIRLIKNQYSWDKVTENICKEIET